MLWVLSTILGTLLDFLPVLAGASSLSEPPLNFHFYFEAGTLLSSLAVALLLVTVVVVLVFCRYSYLVGRKYRMFTLFAAGVAFLLREVFSLILVYGVFSLDYTQLFGGVVSLSFVTLSNDLGWIVMGIDLVATILIAVSSFRMQRQTNVENFYFAGWLFVILVIIEFVEAGLYSLGIIFFSVHSFLALVTIVSALFGAFAAGSFIVLGVALRKVAAAQKKLEGKVQS